MTLYHHFALNSVLCRYVWSSEAWLSKLEQLRHRAVSLWQHSFLVDIGCSFASMKNSGTSVAY